MWLDEGLAEYFEAPAEERIWGNAHLMRVRWAARFGWRPNLDALEKKGDVSEMTDHDYRDSWAWVHFLMHSSPQTHALLVGYLREIGKGAVPGPFSSVLRKSQPSSEALQVEHFKRWKK